MDISAEKRAKAQRAGAKAMISDKDVWQAALLIVKRYSDDAMLEASARADQLLDDMPGAGGGPVFRRLHRFTITYTKMRTRQCPPT
jgi:hypothetical protein